MTNDQLKGKIRDLKHGESYTSPELGDAGAEICRVHDQLILFEIPQYGGKPQYVGTYGIHDVDNLVKVVAGWT